MPAAGRGNDMDHHLDRTSPPRRADPTIIPALTDHRKPGHNGPMALSLPRPSRIVSFAVSTAGRAVSTATAVASVPLRVLRLVDEIEVLLVRVTAIVDEARSVTDSAAVVVREAARTSADAAEAATTARALIAAYEPPARQFVEHLSPEEVDAAIRMVDELPRLAQHLNEDVMPILATLDRVGPDIHELLGVTRDLRQAIVGIPGFAALRRRGEGKETG